MSWSDELEEQILYHFGKDPPSEDKDIKKKEIKKKIREELSKNPTLSNILKQNKAEGKFIKEFTDQLMGYNYSPRDIGIRITYAIKHSCCPIDNALCWRNTSQGHSYWKKLNSIVSENLRKTKF
jgi:hypothetical protein